MCADGFAVVVCTLFFCCCHSADVCVLCDCGHNGGLLVLGFCFSLSSCGRLLFQLTFSFGIALKIGAITFYLKHVIKLLHIKLHIIGSWGGCAVNTTAFAIGWHQEDLRRLCLLRSKCPLSQLCSPRRL